MRPRSVGCLRGVYVMVEGAIQGGADCQLRGTWSLKRGHCDSVSSKIWFRRGNT